MRESAAATRNRIPILEVIRRLFEPPARVLEVGSGTGQHAACFASALPGLDWQPSDRDAALFPSIEAWARREGVPAPRAPLLLDVTGDAWPADPFDGVFSANLIHIAPWEACLGLLRGAARCLEPRGALVLYGPFRVGGRHTAPSNEAFDRDLRGRDPRWGVRDVERVEAEAGRCGFGPAERIPMPANNQIVVLRRARGDAP